MNTMRNLEFLYSMLASFPCELFVYAAKRNTKCGRTKQKYVLLIVEHVARYSSPIKGMRSLKDVFLFKKRPYVTAFELSEVKTLIVCLCVRESECEKDFGLYR